MSELYERLENENGKQYAAFCAFRDLGTKRTLRAASAKVYPHLAAHPGGSISAWSVRFRWLERAAAWDDEVDRKRRETEIEEVIAMRKRHVTQAQALQAKAIDRLTHMLPAEMKVSDVLNFFIEAAKLERSSLGQPVEIQRHEVTGKDGGPVQHKTEVVETIVRTRQQLEALRAAPDPNVEVIE